MELDHMTLGLDENSADEHKTREELIRELVETRAQLSIEKHRNQELSDRLTSQEELRRFAQFPEQNPNPVVRCTPQGRILYANSAARRWLATFGGQDGNCLPDQVAKAAANVLPQNCGIETEISTPCGQIFNIAVLRPSGETYVNLYCHDITERKQVEAALRESEARLRNLSDNPPLGLIYQIDTDVKGEQRRFTYISAGVERLHGITVEAALNDPMAIYGQIIEEDRPLFCEREAAALADLTPFRTEMRLRLPSGEIRWMFVTSAPRRLPNNHIVWDGIEIDITERKQLETDLKESRRQMDTLLSNLPGMVFRCKNDPDWTIEFVSTGCRRLIGYDPDAFIGKPLTSYGKLIDPQDRKKVWDATQAALLEKRSVQTVYRITTAKGCQKWVWDQSVGIFGTKGNLVALEGFITDITELKRAEQALALSEKNYRELIETANSIILRWHCDGTIRFINDYGLRFFGYAKEELLNRDVRILVPQVEEDTGRDLSKLVEQVVEHPQEFACWQNENIKKDGERTWVAWTNKAISDEQGDVYEILAIGNDITALKKAEAALRESEARYHGILDTMLEGCQIIGFDWRYLYLNDAVVGHARRDREELLGRTMMEVYPGIEKTELFRSLRRCMHEREPHRMENEFIYPDGERHWYELSIQPAPEGIFILSIDINARKRIEVERLENERRQQQIAKSESLARMAGAVAHHFNNILAVVLGNLELAIDDLQPDEETVRLLVSAEEAARRAVEMSRLMLLFLGQSPGKTIVLDLARICEKQMEVLSQKIPKGIDLVGDLPRTGPFINADPDQIAQLLAHLVANAWEAIKAIPGSVRVTVETENGAQIPKCSRFPLEWEPTAEVYACFSVADSGCGMTEETINRIFDPFFTDKFIGRGLGLAMVIGIIKSHEGCIVVNSALGRGSTLRVYLPLAKEIIKGNAVRDENTIKKNFGSSLGFIFP